MVFDMTIATIAETSHAYGHDAIENVVPNLRPVRSPHAPCSDARLAAGQRPAELWRAPQSDTQAG